MKHIKSYESSDNKLKKFIELNLLNLIVICEVLTEANLFIKVKKLYTYDTISKSLSENKEEPTTLIYDNFTKEMIGNQSNNIEELLEPLKIKQDINKFNL